MSFRNLAFVTGGFWLAAACGGSAFSGSDDAGQAGSSNAGTSSGHAGKPGTSGSSSGGSGQIGGTSAVAGTIGVAGGPNCFAIPCAYPVCEDGAEPVTKPGECCPTCPSSAGCEGVTCQPIRECGQGYELAQPAGACCPGCVPKPGGVACAEIACAPDKVCPLGYVRGDLVGGCCYDCVPDPLFCNEASDCVTADRPRSCCGCPEAISQRMYDADECWSDVNAPRMIPQSCYPQVTCDAVCGACARPGPLLCANHRCALGQLK